VNEILTHFKQTGSIKLSRHSECQLHRTLCDYDIEVCHGICLSYLRLLLDCDRITALVFNPEKNTGSLPGRIAYGAVRDMWGIGIRVNNMEDTYQGWIYSDPQNRCNVWQFQSNGQSVHHIK